MSPDFACEICGNAPDEDGWLEHGRGCYKLSADGGDTEFIPEACPRVAERATDRGERGEGGQLTC